LSVARARVDGEVPDDGHIFGAMSGSEARLVLFEDDVEDPVEAVFDAPMAAHGVGGGLGGEGRGGDKYRVSKRPRSLSSVRETTLMDGATPGDGARRESACRR